MQFTELDLKRTSLLILIAILGVLAFFIVKSILVALVAGLVLAYMFKPLYNKLYSKIKSKNISALLISLFIILLIVIPLWFLVPLMFQQVFDVFTTSQNIGYTKIISTIFPTASASLVSQLGLALGNFAGKMTTIALETLNGFFLDLPSIGLELFIAFFVFFYAMRDSDDLKKFFSDLSPFSKNREKAIVEEFKNVTDSVVFGQIIIGFVQGGLAGLGLLLFGVDNVLVLTTLAVFLSILPILGPFIVWIPVAIFLFASGQTGIAVGYTLYNLLVVSLVDNALRMYIVSRKSTLSPAIVLSSMIGGFFFLGLVGFLLGPLIVSYFIMILRAYKDNALQTLIHDHEDEIKN
ncbi:MAG: AI-2E family transporter [Nanoarchaeota archaeon]